MVGPRNPFGYLALVVVTVHGEISVHYQRNGSIFSTFSTTIPKSGHRDISRGSTGCYGMSLAGLGDWQRLSHASMELDKSTVKTCNGHDASSHTRFRWKSLPGNLLFRMPSKDGLLV